MRIRETNIDERLDQLENMDTENSGIFLCDKKTGSNVFHNKTVAKLMQNKGITHAILIFEDTVPRLRAESIAKKIGDTIEWFNRAVEIDIFLNVQRELFDMIREECNV